MWNIAAGGLALAAGLAPVAVPATVSPADRCPVAAHRGDHRRWTENSRNAFRVAIVEGADYLETDVQATRDGTFVLMHDPTVDRTTNGHGSVGSMSYRQLHRLRLNDGEHVPTLAGVLAMARPSGVQVLLETKWIPRRRWPALVRLIDWFGASRVVVHSFQRRTVLAFHRSHPSLRTGVDSGHPLPVPVSRRFGSILVRYRSIGGPWLRRMRTARVPVYVYTLDTSREWRRFSGRVDLVITDDVPGYARFRVRGCP